ncbi:hypothetical protein IEN85_12310 [Pelagicoccus sp. NFK12]|uniref:AMP-dependent synthetase/ligase domain-containing protein n=1 Tax=Pelagicoccus enzymogenes TaxID=2773457 RepID=A0A927F8J5_9BACT|nr:hypothetical protein [Pelagicoccus enzymogenes]MBD5780277.1 hypothetical protein [Pelagicoccus enzymogenes]
MQFAKNLIDPKKGEAKIGSAGWTSRSSEDIAADGYDLIERFESVAAFRAEDPAMYLRDPRTKRGEASRYLSLAFSDLRLERDAWVKRFRSLGVSSEDRVLLWLPCGLAKVAAAHALLKMGAELGLADEALELPANYEGWNPTVAVVSSVALGACRRAFGSQCEILEVRSPLLRLASAVKSSQMASDSASPLRSSVCCFSKSRRGEVERVRFEPRQIGLLLRTYESAFRIGSEDTEIATDALSCVLFPSLGVCTAVVDAGFGTLEGDCWAGVASAVEELGVSRLRDDVEGWMRFLQACESREMRFASVKQVFVETDTSLRQSLCSRLRAAFPRAEFYSLFGVSAAPVAAVRPWPESGSASEKGEVGYAMGPLQAGLEARVTEWGNGSAGDRCEVKHGCVGELRLQGPAVGQLAGKTDEPLLAFRDEAGALRLCGRSSEVVRTSFGRYIPARCEPVFERHEKVEMAKLVSLNAKAGIRPGIVIAVKEGELPRGKLAESKFKAELLQLGAELEDTKLVLDFFFVERIPNLPRESLSRRYSTLAKLKSLF